MKKYWPITFACALCLCFAMGWFWKTDISGHVSSKDAFVDGIKVSVTSDVTARIMKLHVDEGSAVKIGDVLAELDASMLLAEKQGAEATAYALEESVCIQQFQLEKIKNDYQRISKVFQEKIISVQAFDHAEKDFHAAEAMLRMTKAQLTAAIAQVKSIDTKISHTRITAPIDGKIVKRYLWEGDLSYPGQAIFALYDTNHVWVTTNIEEKKIRKIKPHAPVHISIDAYPKMELQGTVLVIKEAAASEFSLIPPDNAAGNFTKVEQRIPIKIAITQPPTSPSLFPGMSAKIKIQTTP